MKITIEFLSEKVSSARPAMGKVCIRCGVEKPPDQFKIRQKDSTGGKKGELTSKCAACMDEDREYQRRRRQKRQRDASEGEDDDHAWEVDPDTPVTSMDDFLARLGSCADANAEDTFKFAARVDCGAVAPVAQNARDRAEALVKLIGERTSWRWM